MGIAVCACRVPCQQLFSCCTPLHHAACWKVASQSACHHACPVVTVLTFGAVLLLPVLLPVLQVTVGELLGRGGCGAVYAGIWRDKPVAVKVVQQVVNAAAAAAAAAATVDTAIDVAPKDAAAAARAAFRRLPLSGFASPVSTHGAARGRGSSDTPRPTGDPTDPDSAALPQPLQLVPQQPLQPHRLSQPSLPQPGDYRNPDRNLGLRIAPGVTATASCGAGMASTAAVSDSMSLSTAETPPVGARRRPMLGDAAASVKKLRHPNVLRTYAYASMCMAPQAPPPPGRSGGYGAPLPPPPFIRHEHHVLLELCDGGSLRMWLDQHSRALEQLTSGGGGGGGSGAVRNAAKAALEQDATVTLGTLGTVGTVGTAADVGSVSLLPGTFMLNTAAGLPIPSPSPSPLVPQFSIPAQRYSLTGALTTLTAIGGVEAWVEATVAAAEAVATAVVSPAPPAEPVLEATPPGTPLTTIYSAAFPRKDMPSRRAGSTSGPPLPPLPPPASQPALSALPMFTPLKPHFTGYESEQVQGPTTVSHGTLSTLPSLAGPSGLQAKLSSSAWHTAHGASGCATSLPSETAATTSAAASTEAGVPCHNSSADVPGERRLAAPRLDRQLSGAAHERVSLAHAPSCSSDALTLRHQPSIDPALAGAPFGSAAANTTSSTTTNGPTVAGSDACSSPQPIPRTSSLNWDVNAPPDSVVRAWVGASELTRIAEDRPAGQADMDTDTDPDPDRVREHEEGDMMGPTHAMYAPTGAHVHGTSRTGTQAGTMGQGGSDATPLRGTLMIGDEADGADGQDPDDLTSVTVSALSEPSASVVSNPFTTGASLGAVGAGSGAGLRARLLRNQAGLGGSVGVVADGVAAAGRRGPGCNSTSSWLGGRSGDMTCPPGMAMAIGMGMGGSTSGMVSGAGLGSSAVGREHVAAWALEVGSTGGQGRYATGVKGLWTPGAASSSQGVGMETAEGLGWTTTLDSVSVPASVPGGTPVRSGTPVRMREAVEAAGGASPEGAAGSPLAPVVLRSAPCGAGGGAVGAGSELAGDGAVAGKEPAAAGGRAGAQGLARVVEEASCGGSVSVAARRDKDARGSTGQQNGGGGGNSCGDGTSAAAGGSSHSTSATAGYSSYYYSNDPTVGSGRVFNGSLGASGRGTHKGGPRMWPSAAAGAASGQHTAGGAPWRANAADNSNNNSFFGRRSPGPGPAGFCFPFPNQDPDTASAPVASSKRSPFSPPLPLVPEGVSQRLSAHQALLQDANTLPLKPETQQAAAWVGSGLAQQRAATSGGTAASRRSAAGDATSSHTTVNTRPGSSSTSNNSDIRLVPVPGLGPPYASRRHRAWVRQGTTRRHPLLSAAVSSSTAALDAFMLPAHPSVTGGLQQPLSHNLHTPHLAQNLHQHQLLHRNASLAGGTTTTNGTNVATGTHNSSAFQVVSQRCIVVDSGDDDDDVGGIYDLLEEDGEGEAAAGGAGGAGGRVEGWEERRGGVPARGSASDEVTLAGSSRVAGGSSAAQTGADSVGQVQGASGGMQDQQLQQGSAHLLPQSQSSEQRSLSQRTGLSPETSTSQPMLGARFDLLPAQRSPDLQPTLAAGAAPFTAAAPTNAHPTVSPGDAALPLATRSPTPPSPAPAAVPRGPSADPDILNQLNRRAVSMVRSILQAAANNAAGPGENNNNANGGQATGQATADAAAEGEAGAGAQGGRRLQAPPRALCAAPPDGAAVLESLGMRREQLGYLCLALDCLVEAASGLAYLHDQGIVHGVSGGSGARVAGEGHGELGLGGSPNVWHVWQGQGVGHGLSGGSGHVACVVCVAGAGRRARSGEAPDSAACVVGAGRRTLG